MAFHHSFYLLELDYHGSDLRVQFNSDRTDSKISLTIFTWQILRGQVWAKYRHFIQKSVRIVQIRNHWLPSHEDNEPTTFWKFAVNCAVNQNSILRHLVSKWARVGLGELKYYCLVNNICNSSFHDRIYVHKLGVKGLQNIKTPLFGRLPQW